MTDGGDSLWTRAYGQALSFAGYDIVAAPDGGFLIAGSTNGQYYFTIRTPGKSVTKKLTIVR